MSAAPPGARSLPEGAEAGSAAGLPGAEELRQLAAAAGIDAATTLLYRRVLDSPTHGPFIRRIGEICRRPSPAPWRAAATVAIVPGAFYRENPASGADGHVVREEAERLGCATELVPLSSRGTLRENARILCDWLGERPGRPTILVSLSKGGADVKAALAEPDAAPAFAAVGAWVNLCGILDGTPMADWLLSPRPGALLMRVYHRLRGQSLGFLGDLRYGTGRPLSAPLRLPAHLSLVSVVGFPLREHLVRGIARRCHRRLTPLGPNDGSLVLADVCAAPGLLFPVWGGDHYLQPREDPGGQRGPLAEAVPTMRELVVAILQYLGESPGSEWSESASRPA